VALGTLADGFVSSQPWRCYGNTPNLMSVERCYGADGSSLVRAVQRVVGADVDGLMGPQTVRCLQAWPWSWRWTWGSWARSWSP
jgi:murein L,D-transpeptidase YcbB/YkuD